MYREIYRKYNIFFQKFHEKNFPASTIQRKNTKSAPVALLRVAQSSMEPDFLFLPRLPGFGPLLRNFGPLLRNNGENALKSGQSMQKSGSIEFLVLFETVTFLRIVI